MLDLFKKAKEFKMSRRAFIGWSSAIAATAAVPVTRGLVAKAAGDENSADSMDEGKWISAACWHNCGGRCLNKVLVKDGVVIRQKTDDTHEDSPDFPQQRGCWRGRSQRHQVFGADRLKYPMKRKNWEPGGGKKELRGKDEWVRISWDEAIDIVTSELKRIKEKYGNKSILSYHQDKVLNAYGGSLIPWGVTSDGAWPLPVAKMSGGLARETNGRLDWRNTKLLVLFGANPAWSSAGNPNYHLSQIKKAGAKIISIDPFYNPTAQTNADQWIPIRPSTDTAFLLGVAYYMIENNLQDQDFLDKYTVGFDAEHMPEGADTKENFKDYVLGTYDNTPKTPEWASEVCGAPADTIRRFALEIATTKPMIMSSSYAPGRTYRGQQYCQAFMTVGWMTGNVGTSGGGVWLNPHSRQISGTKELVKSGGSGQPSVTNPLFPYPGGYSFAEPFATDWYGPAYEEIWDAILNGKYHAGVRGEIPCDIQLLWMVRDGSGGNMLNQIGGINKGIDAFRKVEFVVTNDIVLSTVSKYADVVLPATTPWEKVGMLSQGNKEALFVYSQVTEPLYEAKDEEEMHKMIAEKLGLNVKELYPLSPKQQFINQIASSTVLGEDGVSYEPLVTITQSDIKEWGVEGEPQKGKISLSEFIENGVYQAAKGTGENLIDIAGKAFRDDPEKNPLNTASGKLEIHCQTLSDFIKAFGFTETPPIAKYEAPVEGYEETFSNYEKKEKGEFPLQMFTIHYPRRSHSVFDNVPQLREAFPQEFYMNPDDAKERGIKEGDTVLIKSNHGKVIRPVTLTERMMPGVVTLGEGAWVERDDETGIDKAGATNSLNGARLSGQGEEPWNTCIIEVEKWEGEPLKPDQEWPQRIIF